MQKEGGGKASFIHFLLIHISRNVKTGGLKTVSLFNNIIVNHAEVEYEKALKQILYQDEIMLMKKKQKLPLLLLQQLIQL